MHSFLLSISVFTNMPLRPRTGSRVQVDVFVKLSDSHAQDHIRDTGDVLSIPYVAAVRGCRVYVTKNPQPSLSNAGFHILQRPAWQQAIEICVGFRPAFQDTFQRIHCNNTTQEYL